MLKSGEDFEGKVSAQLIKMSACTQGKFCTRAMSASAEQKMRSLPTLGELLNLPVIKTVRTLI